MTSPAERPAKARILVLVWGAWLFSYMIRYALGIVAPALMKTYHIPPKTMGYILSGWNWSYTGGMLAMGPVVDRVGPWIVTGLGSVVWGGATIALPLMAQPWSLFAIRMMFGLGHSMLVAATAASISRRFGAQERARAVATVFSGNQVGLAAGGTLAAFLLTRFGWPSVFQVIGGASLVLTLLWFLLYPDRQPAPRPPSGAPPARWLSFFRSRSTWGMALGQLGYLYALGVFVSWLPGYLVLERKMTLLKSGVISTLPFWVGMFGTLAGGWLGDWLVRRGLRTITSRKLIIGSGLTAATVLVTWAAVARADWLAVTLLTLCIGCLRLTTGSANSMAIDLAPRESVGALSSIQNFFGNIGGILAPIVTGYLVSATGSFTVPLMLAGLMALLGAMSYVVIVTDNNASEAPVPRASEHSVTPVRNTPETSSVCQP